MQTIVSFHKLGLISCSSLFLSTFHTMPSKTMSSPLQQVEVPLRCGEHPASDDEACIVKSLTQKRKMCECPESPTPSLESEASQTPHNKRQKKPLRRKVSFDVDKDDNLRTILSTFDKYEGDVASDVWWSPRDLKKILKREGRIVLNLKIDASKNGDSSCMANALKQSINETFKKCVDAPLTIDKDNAPSIFEFIPDEDIHTATTTTRGLERYLAPIMGAHREMVVKTLLIAQGQLSTADPNYKMEVLGARYEHLSKIAANFAVVMGQCDEQLATGNYC